MEEEEKEEVDVCSEVGGMCVPFSSYLGIGVGPGLVYIAQTISDFRHAVFEVPSLDMSL
jgi:hypothetical protein